MDKIAVLSDIHGNLEALKVCLEDIDRRDIKIIICLGDIVAKGVHPMECINLLKERNAVFIRGNCDRFFSEKYSEGEITPRIAFNQNLVDEKTRDFLYHLPMSYERYISGAYVRFVHATPWADDVYVGLSSNLETEWRMYQPSEHTSNQVADVVVYGHTHAMYLSKAFHHTLINAGSVGNNIDVYQNEKCPGNHKLTTMASYLIIEGNLDEKEIGPLAYSLIQLPYDIEKELSSPKENPEKEAYIKELRYGKYRDLSKLNIQKK